MVLGHKNSLVGVRKRSRFGLIGSAAANIEQIVPVSLQKDSVPNTGLEKVQKNVIKIYDILHDINSI